MLTCKNISKNFGQIQALQHIDFMLTHKSITGLLGSNGAGKTTLMKIIAGVLAPSKGQVSFQHKNYLNARIELQKQIGYVPENLPLYLEMSVLDYLKFVANTRFQSNNNHLKIKIALEKVEMQAKALTKIQHLSQGQKQRIAIAQAIIHTPQLLILDEPTNGLDPKQTIRIRELIQKLSQEATVLISTHIMQEVTAICDHVLFLQQGKLQLNTSLEQLQKSQKIHLQTNASLLELKEALSTLTDKIKIECNTKNYLVSLPEHLKNHPNIINAIALLLIKNKYKINHIGYESYNLESFFTQPAKRNS